jgi:hypothetical protein
MKTHSVAIWKDSGPHPYPERVPLPDPFHGRLPVQGEGAALPRFDSVNLEGVQYKRSACEHSRYCGPFRRKPSS